MNYSIKLDLTKIAKDKLFKSEKTGSIYLDAVIIMKDSEDQYGNIGMIVQSQTKEEREQGIKSAILGNAKELVKQETKSAEVKSSDLPF